LRSAAAQLSVLVLAMQAFEEASEAFLNCIMAVCSARCSANRLLSPGVSLFSSYQGIRRG